MSAARSNRSFRRPRLNIPQRKLYVIVGEGELTEKEYIGLFSSNTYTKTYESPKGHHGGSAKELVRCMRDQRKKHAPSTKAAPTEYWIIADVEEESKRHDLQPLFDWVMEDEDNHLAITYPQFENWLLLHYQKKMGSMDPVKDVGKYISGYSSRNKSIGKRITEVQVRTALDNAEAAGVVVMDRAATMKELSQGKAYYTSMPQLVRKLLG